MSWKCDICRKDCDDPIEYGDICTKADIKVHYYCLLLSTHLVQRGKDTGGILGFLIRDIKNEINAARKRICAYCGEYCASIKCSCCDIYFHLKCGLENYCLFQFINEFKSFCHKHHGIQHKEPHSSDTGCWICRKQMGNYNPITSITSKCCPINCWVHRKCLKLYALAAGYYLKCLWCTDAEFRDDVRFHGVFVPDRDAEWEKIKENYAGLYENIRKKCMAKKCICPKGNEYKSKKWDIDVCSTCGSFAIHKLCHTDSDKKSNIEYVCKNCRTLKESGVLKKFNITGIYGDGGLTCDATMFLLKSQCIAENYSYSLKLSQVAESHSLFMISSDSENEEEELNELDKNTNHHSEKEIMSKKNYYDCYYNPNTLEIYGFKKSTSDDKKNEQNILNSISKNEIPTENFISIPKENTIEADEFITELVKDHLESVKKNLLATLTVSESDSDESITALSRKIAKKQNIIVPRPKIL